MNKTSNCLAYITAFATLGLFFVALGIGYIQYRVLSLQEGELTDRRVAPIKVVGMGGGFSPEPGPDGNYWIHAEVTFRNISKVNHAKEIRILYQAYGVDSWTGLFEAWIKKQDDEIVHFDNPKTGEKLLSVRLPQMAEPRRVIDLKPGGEFTTIMQSQTAPEPLKRCKKDEKRFFLASRIDWEHPNGAMGCRTTFIEISCPAGSARPPGNRRLLIRSIPWPPASDIKPPPAIWPCPK